MSTPLDQMQGQIADATSSNQTVNELPPWFNDALKSVSGLNYSLLMGKFKPQYAAHLESKVREGKTLTPSENDFLSNWQKIKKSGGDDTSIGNERYGEFYRKVTDGSDSLNRNIKADSHNPYFRVAEIPNALRFAHARAEEEANRIKPEINKAMSIIEGYANRFPDEARDYLNPFSQYVLDDVDRRARRAWKEDMEPNIDSTYIGLGQFGSQRHTEQKAKAYREFQDDLNGKQLQALAGHYLDASKIFSADQARRLGIADQMARMGVAKNAEALGDIGLLENVGRYQQQQNQALLNDYIREYTEQTVGPMEELARHAAIANNMPIPPSTVTSNYSPQGPQLNTLGTLSSVAGNILGGMMTKAHGGSVTQELAARSRQPIKFYWL